MNASTDKPRLLVIALAEATLDLVVPWAEAGHLPTLQRLLCNGSWGNLKSPPPLVTPQMWGNIVTGRNPGHHGLFDFRQRTANGRLVKTSGARNHQTPIWHWLGEQGVRSLVFNVPFSYPPKPFNGTLVAGQDAPGAHPGLAWPPAVYHDIVERFGSWRMNAVFPGGRQKSDYLTLLNEHIRWQTDVLSHLIKTADWQFALTFYSATAMAQHYFWGDMLDQEDNRYKDILLNTYRALDQAIQRLMTAAGENCQVMIISECGAGPMRAGIDINLWLHQQGWLQWRKPRKQITDHGHKAVKPDWKKKLAHQLPPPVQYYLNRYLGPWMERLRNHWADGALDFQRTQAWADPEGKEGGIFINLKGRDPEGIIAPGEAYKTLVEQIRTALLELRDPETGQKAVEAVYTPEEYYQGACNDESPDLIIIWQDTAYMPCEMPVSEGVFGPRWRKGMSWPTTGSHRVNGMLITSGPGVAPGTIKDASIFDLFPTWCKLLGTPIPAALEGTPIESLSSRETPAMAPDSTLQQPLKEEQNAVPTTG